MISKHDGYYYNKNKIMKHLGFILTKSAQGIYGNCLKLNRL